MRARRGNRKMLRVVMAWVGLLAAAGPLRAQGVGEEVVRDTNVGYIDPAPLLNALRLRFDSSYDNNRPSRAEFFYPRAGQGFPGPRFADTLSVSSTAR